jgi:hypothetical protein
MWHMPCSSSQFVEVRHMWTEQLSRWIINRFWCGALHRGKIACSNGMSMFVTKYLLFIFGIFWEPINNIEATRVSHDLTHEFFASNIKSRFCDDVISRQSPHATWWYIQEKSRLITGHKMMLVITFGGMQEWQHCFCIFLSFFAQIMRQQIRHPMQMERYEANRVMSMQIQ